MWVNVTYKGLWKTDIIIEAVWYYSSTTTAPQPSPGPSPGPSPAPSPSPKPPSVKVSNFTIDKDLIKTELKSGETKRETIKVSNTGKTKLTITSRIQYLDEFLSFDENGPEYIFEINPDETKEIEVNFTVRKDQIPGVYPGKIIFNNGSLEKTVLVIVEVESENPLFDVKVEVLPEYRAIYPGDKVEAQLTLYNLGSIESVNTKLEYGVKSLDGEIIKSENEIVVIETQFTTTKNIDLPVDLKPGNYVFYSEVSYDNIIGTGSSMFQVIERRRTELYIILFSLLIAIVSIIIIFVFNLRKKHKVKKKGIYKKRRHKRLKN